MKKNKNKKTISIVIDKNVNNNLKEKSINKSKLINSLLEKLTESEILKFVK